AVIRTKKTRKGGRAARRDFAKIAKLMPLTARTEWLGCPQPRPITPRRGMKKRTDKLTIKAQEAIADARDLAASKGQPEVTPQHLLLTLLNQEEGVVPRLLAKVGADPKRVAAALERELESLPVVRGAGVDVGVGRPFRELYEAASREAAKFKDEFISTEHF